MILHSLPIPADSSRHGGAYKWWVLTVIIFSVLLVGIDSTAVNLALPTISAEMKAPVSQSQWVIAAYLIAVALSSLPVAGRLADFLGRKAVFIGGFVIFTLASACCGLAPDIEILIAMRVLQAIGAAMLLTNSNVITLAVFPVRQHGLAMGIINMVFSTGYALGFILGGWFISDFGWRFIFLINIPVGIVATMLGLRILDESELTTGRTGRRFDAMGMVFSVMAIGGLMIGLEGYAERGTLIGRDLALLSLGVISLAAFIRAELRHPTPLLEIRLFRSLVFALGASTRFLINFIMNATSFFIPFYTQVVLGFTPLQGGLLILPFTIALAVLNPLAGGLSDKFGARWMMTGGLLGSAVALLGMSGLKQVPPGESTLAMAVQVSLGMLILGAAGGLFISPNNSMILDSVSRKRAGAASGCIWCLCFLGSAMGTAFSAAMLHQGEKADAAGHGILQLTSPRMMQAITDQQTTVFHILVLLSLLGAIVCFLQGGSGSRGQALTD